MEKYLNENSLDQKVIVITGATSGVGRAAALAFAQEKALLVLAGRRTLFLEELVEECEALGSAAIAVTTDVTKYGDVQKLAQEAVQTFGKIDVWVNNAGVLAAGEFDLTPMEIHDKVIQTNLMGYMYGAHAVLPYFKDRNSGIIINNISVGGWLPTPYAAAYTASKFALTGFSDSLKAELSKWKDIHVCDLFPAFLDTPGMQHAANYTGKALTPAPPVYSPERVARAMVKLARYPKNSTTTDLFAPAMRLSYSLFPGFTRTATANVIERYFQKADDIASTSGNVLAPVKYGSAISGGWQFILKNKLLDTAVKAAVVGAGILIASAAIVARLK